MDLRYKGQSYELTLTVPGNDLIGADITAIIHRFHRRHRRLYGYCREDAPVEAITLRLAATGALPEIKPRPRAAGDKPARPGTRKVYLAGEYQNVPVYDRRQIDTGWSVEGPAVITQADSTTLIWPSNRARCDRWNNIIIETGVS